MKIVFLLLNKKNLKKVKCFAEKQFQNLKAAVKKALEAASKKL